MKILVINAGSSSLKFQLIDMNNEMVLAKGICEKIGLEKGIVNYKNYKDKEISYCKNINNHEESFCIVKDLLINSDCGVINSLDEVFAIGHRVVQGGKFNGSMIINKDVIDEIEKLIPLAPLHNPAHLQAIKACMKVLGDTIPQVAVFDTAFHCTMPEKAYVYPIPYKYYEKYKIRRYGFHGTSHYYVSRRCAKLLGKNIKDTKIITCHLGNGSSIAAINAGKSVDTTMGFTPTDGIIMGTRCGSLDPGIINFLIEKENLSPAQIDKIINKESGLLGISGISSDDREITKKAALGDKRAILAQDILKYQVGKFIAGYIAVLGGCDAIVFTAGLGENQPNHRKGICDMLSFMGLEINDELNNNAIRGKESEISTTSSKIKVFVIPTNEELVIAQQTKSMIEKK